MKKWLFLFLASTIWFSACKKNDLTCKLNAPSNAASATETAYLQNYLSANGIVAASKNGMFYNITNPGSGSSPNLCSRIAVTYTGNLIDGTADGAEFDASGSTPLNTVLQDLIVGWQLILPLVKMGGSVTLYIPPSLGYGSQQRTNAAGAVVIPANSYLKFTITLVSVQ